MADYLTLSDRCDRCGSAAYVRAIFLAGILDLCGHHARKHLDAIAATPGLLEVHDETHRLTAGNEKRAKEGVS